MNLRKHKRRLYRKMLSRVGIYTYYLPARPTAHKQLAKKIPISAEQRRNLLTGELGTLYGMTVVTG